jgi:acetyl-CoA carboxylase biotin carboxyl carrier protein
MENYGNFSIALAILILSMCAAPTTGELLDFHEIQQLTSLVKDADLRELEIERGNMRLRIVNSSDYGRDRETHPFQQPGGSCSTIIRDDKVAHAANLDDSNGYHIIKSPVVGTFYSAPSPESPDFVARDTPVDVNSTVCIIEAMKVMNEIQADVKGIVADVLVQNGQPVEFGQPLFKVKKL